MIKTYKEVSEFKVAANAYLNGMAKDALYIPLKRAVKKIDGITKMETIEDELEDYRIKNCIKGDKEAIIYKDNQYQFTAEAMINLKRLLKQKDKEEIEVELDYFVKIKDIPSTIPASWRRRFEGFIFPEELTDPEEVEEVK